MFRTVLIMVCFIILSEGLCFSKDLRAVTEDGRKVVLKENGTYRFVDSPKTPLTSGAVSYLKPANATIVFKPKGNRFLIWYDPSVWRDKKSAESDKPTFIHKDGDIGAIVIAERVDMSLTALKELVIKSAREAAPDARIIHEENRVVNGKNILCLRMQGTIEGIEFIYYGYYYAGKAGVIQHITFAPSNLFSEYEPDMLNFLNGLIINE